MNQFFRYEIKRAKPKQLCINTGINYNYLENEINLLQIEHQSAENKHKLAQEKLDKLLETHGWDEAEFEGVWRDIEKSSRRLIHVASLLHNCQMMKDGILPFPKPRTDRAWSDNPIFDMYLEGQHRKKKELDTSKKRSGFGGELIHCAGKIRGGDQWRGSVAFSMSTIGSPTYRRKATLFGG